MLSPEVVVGCAASPAPPATRQAAPHDDLLPFSHASLPRQCVLGETSLPEYLPVPSLVLVVLAKQLHVSREEPLMQRDFQQRRQQLLLLETLGLSLHPLRVVQQPVVQQPVVQQPVVPAAAAAGQPL